MGFSSQGLDHLLVKTTERPMTMLLLLVLAGIHLITAQSAASPCVVSLPCQISMAEN